MPVDSHIRRRSLAQLEADGLISADGSGWRTTRRWQGAMARIALALYHEGERGDDLRVPITLALLDVYRYSLTNETLADLVETMLPVEARSLGLAAQSRS